MPEIFPTYQMSYDELLRGYLTEAKGLSFIYKTDIYKKLLDLHGDYNAYLKDNKDNRAVKRYINDVKKKGRYCLGI